MSIKKTILFLFICLHYSYSYGQANPSIIVRNKFTNKTIPYVTVKSIGKPVGTYSDSLGKFYLSVDFSDSLAISSIGYIGIRIDKRYIQNHLIYLEPQVTELDTAIVKNRKKVGEATVGNINLKKSTIWGSGGYGDEFAQKIILPDSNKVYKLKKINIGASRYVSTIPMVVHIYTVDAYGKPGENILLDKVILSQNDFNKKQQRFTVDVSMYNIFLHEPAIYVSAEWMPISNKGQALGCTALILTGDIPEQQAYTSSYFIRSYPFLTCNKVGACISLMYGINFNGRYT